MGQRYFKNSLTFGIPSKNNKVHVKPKAESAATFQKSMRLTLLIGQLFSLIPVVGLFSDNTKNFKFVKTSWKCAYTFLTLFGQIFMTIMCIHRSSRQTTTLNGTTPIIFYGTACITMVMFFRVARQWPVLVQTISRTEELDPNFDGKLTLKCNVTCIIVLVLALAEHILSLLSAFAGAEICFPNKSTYEGFVTHFYPWVFNTLPYSPILGGVTQFLHFQATFIWNFSDLFVICMSYYLTSRLEQVNRKLLVAQGKYLPQEFWRSVREEYGRATQLVRKVDDVISGIVFISFANNLFFICLQLFNTLENTILGGYEAAAYFLFSLVYLISRSVAVSLIASQVNTASDVPAPVLYDVPSPVYCVEVQRFLDQVHGDKIALSGLQFFSVTRGLLLTVAGTIVTYELVMFQFNSSSPTTTVAPNITTTTPALVNTILGGYEAAAYFLFSLVYLISRSVAVSLIASQVNTASDVPAPVLYDVPSPVYCVEIQRFLDQVHGDKIALSGLQFFSVTRGLLLTVAGTIVTYELVMFQFNSSSPTTTVAPNITTTTPALV